MQKIGGRSGPERPPIFFIVVPPDDFVWYGFLSRMLYRVECHSDSCSPLDETPILTPCVRPIVRSNFEYDR